MTTRNTFLYGSDQPLPEDMPLAAGPFRLSFEAGALHSIWLGDREAINQVYISLRDRAWNDVPAKISNLKIQSSKNSFTLTFDAENQQGEIDFAWQGAMMGDRSGVIRFEIQGVARSTFWRSRLGFCVLHPARECSGMPCRVEKTNGVIQEAFFPILIEPHQPFTDIRAISYLMKPGLSVEVRFEGEVFEMEDQRNWSDASFKTYATPLSLPYPVEVKAGTVISQAVTIKLQGRSPTTQGRAHQQAAIPALSIQDGSPIPLPQLGLGSASHGQPLTAREVERLRALRLNYLRLDLPLDQSNVEDLLRQAWTEAQALGVALEIALTFSENGQSEMKKLTGLLDNVRPRVSAWLLFDRRQRSTPVSLVELARKDLSMYDPNVPIGGGSKVYFAELNRNRSVLPALDLVCFSLNPQVHTFDNRSLVESLAIQADLVQSARQMIGEKTLRVTPVTLKPRFNPITGQPSAPEPGNLPAEVDGRQMSLFGAGWTLGSLKYLCESGVNGVTYYETTGWRGTMETTTGSPLPDKFHSYPGCVFPLYHVLMDVGEFAGGHCLRVASSHPHQVVGMAVQHRGRRRLILANLSPLPTRVKLAGLGKSACLHVLDETSVEQAMRLPEEWRSQSTGVGLEGENPEVELRAYASARIDAILTN